MLNNFNSGGPRGPLPLHNLQIHDGAWLASILLVIGFMIFNTVEWSIVGLSLIYIILGCHVIREYKAVHGTADIWVKYATVAGAWFVSIFIIPVMPAYVIYNYVLFAREIRQQYGDEPYNTAWKTYMRMLSLTAVAVFIYLVNMYASGPGALGVPQGG